MRRLSTALAAVAVVACFLAPAAAASEGLALTQSGNARFPDRSFVLTLPAEASVTPDRVSVRENGRTVPDLSVLAAGASGKSAVVLVIDTSKSMRGRPIEGAIGAARAFTHRLSVEHQLAIVTFNRSASALLEPTADRAQIEKALTAPPAVRLGTHIHDGVAMAIDILEDGGFTAGSIVVLSDGADTGSDETLASVTERARNAGVRVFTVGLRSESFNPATLKELAGRAQGEYSEASSPRDLERIYDQLGSQLANEFLIDYKSLARPGRKAIVSASVAGFSHPATAEYLAPARAGASVTSGSGLWSSAIAVVAVSFTAALLMATAFVLLLGLLPRPRTLQERLHGFISAAPEVAPAKTLGAALTGSVLEGAQKSLERTRWWATFKEELDVARIRMDPVRIVLWAVVGTLGAAWFLKVSTGSGLAALLGLTVPLFVRVAIKRKLVRQRKLFADQLADNLQVIASAMRAGQSFIGALSVAAQDAAEPARTEFTRLAADEKLGVPLEEALGVVVKRMDNADLEQVVLVAVLQRETGGNTAEVIDRVASTIRERQELRRMIDTLTAQGRLSRWIVSLLPVGLLGLITAINPDYMTPLFETGIGHVLLVLAAAMLVMGSLAIKRIVDIEV